MIGVSAPPDVCSESLERQRQAVLRLAVLLRHDAEVQVGSVERHLQGQRSATHFLRGRLATTEQLSNRCLPRLH